MDESLQKNILYAQKKRDLPFNLTVTGVSMNPVLFENDIITIIPNDTYEIGDILVFFYNNNELLIHRLLEIKNNIYYCKGDNALRTEKVLEEQIIGNAIKIIRNEIELSIPEFNKSLFILSKAVSNTFFKCRFDPIKTRITYIYNLYNKKIIMGEDINVYTKNQKMDFIEVDENSITVFDPESGDTHFLEDTSADIIKIIDTPCDFEKIISDLCEIYDATIEEIIEDVREFLNAVIEKNIVLEL